MRNVMRKTAGELAFVHSPPYVGVPRQVFLLVEIRSRLDRNPHAVPNFQDSIRNPPDAARVTRGSVHLRLLISCPPASTPEEAHDHAQVPLLNCTKNHLAHKPAEIR